MLDSRISFTTNHNRRWCKIRKPKIFICQFGCKFHRAHQGRLCSFRHWLFWLFIHLEKKPFRNGIAFLGPFWHWDSQESSLSGRKYIGALQCLINCLGHDGFLRYSGTICVYRYILLIGREVHMRADAHCTPFHLLSPHSIPVGFHDMNTANSLQGETLGTSRCNTENAAESSIPVILPTTVFQYLLHGRR